MYAQGDGCFCGFVKILINGSRAEVLCYYFEHYNWCTKEEHNDNYTLFIAHDVNFIIVINIGVWCIHYRRVGDAVLIVW